MLTLPPRALALSRVMIAVIAAVVLAGAREVPSPAPKPGSEPGPVLPRPAQKPNQDPAANLETLEMDIEAQKAQAEALKAQAEAAEIEEGDLRRQSISAAAAVQEKEQAITLAEDNLDVLAMREADILAKLGTERARLSETLAALQMLERKRPPAIAVSPEDATKAVRSAILLSDLVPRVRREADALSEQLDQLRSVRSRIVAEREALDAAADALRADQARLDLLMAAKARQRETLAEAMSERTARIAEIARRAEDLSGLIIDLGDDAAAGNEGLNPAVPPPGAQPGEGLWAAPGSQSRQFADARGRMRFPAVGKVVEKFGVPNEGGGTTKGIKIAPRPGSPVVMPFDGRVRYAGPLKVFGQVLIAEAGDDYLIILAGLANVDALVGQWLLAGEPIGRMARIGEDGPKQLYIEFRKSREPFDPLPWLASVTQEG